MLRMIQLTRKPFKTAIAFEITGITVHALSQNSNTSAVVNDVEVFETYDEVMYMITKLIHG